MAVCHYFSNGTKKVPEMQFGALVDQAYPSIFAQPPWLETWRPGEVRNRIARECTGRDSFLTIMQGDDVDPVGGFCWGKVVSANDVPTRVEQAHPVDRSVAGLLQQLPGLLSRRVTYVDEVAVLPRFRHGGGDVRPIRMAQLVYPVGLASVRTKTGILCWSREDSGIVPHLRNWGFEICLPFGEINFYYLPPPMSMARSSEVVAIVESLSKAA